MNLKPLRPGRQLMPSDAKRLEEILYQEYNSPEFIGIYYSYPLNDNRLLLEYVINLYGNDEHTRFFRTAYKKNGDWYLSRDLRTLTYKMGTEDGQNEEMAKVIHDYLGE